MLLQNRRVISRKIGRDDNDHFKVAALLCASGVTDKRLYTVAHPEKAMTFDGKTCPACTTMRLRIVTRSGATGNVLSLRCELD